MKFDRESAYAVVIPVHNGREHTRQCLEALQAAPGPALHVVVVDDGSTDGTSDAVRAFGSVTVLPGDGRLWWSGAVDVGARYAFANGAETVLLLNNDNTVSDNLVTDLFAVAISEPCCVSAVMTARVDGYLEVLMAGGYANWRGRGLGRVESGTRFVPRAERTRADWLPGTALSFSREVFERLGGFDPRFPQYRGDVDFTLRATSAGIPCYVLRDVYVVNDPSQTGLDVRVPVSLRKFLEGFVTYRSNYNVREAVPFAIRHCPRPLLPWYLLNFYARYAYASLKSHWRRPA